MSYHLNVGARYIGLYVCRSSGALCWGVLQLNVPLLESILGNVFVVGCLRLGVESYFGVYGFL